MIGCWEIFTIARAVNEEYDDCSVNGDWSLVAAGFLIFTTFLRVYYIVVAILYFFSIFWIVVCCPNACGCTKWIMGDDFIAEIWAKLEDNEWEFKETETLDPVMRPTCLICLKQFKQGDILMLIPCSNINNMRESKSSSMTHDSMMSFRNSTRMS